MKQVFQTALWIGKIVLGCVVFALGFDLFLEPNALNAGGLSGLAMILEHWLQIGTVGSITMVMNLPLFIIGGIKVGKKFFVGSLIGMLCFSVFLDVLTALPVPQVDPLLATLYGGALCGLGIGVVFAAGASTGGSDIVVRLMKRRLPNMPIGTINMFFDLAVAALTGIAFWDMSRALYSAVAIFVTGQVIDAVVYRFDYSKVALIISDHHEAIAKVINEKLDRGATYLTGQGSYSRQPKQVVLTVVKRQQVADLKRLVVEIDPDAFIVVQEAHQVLGEGFGRYSKESL